MTPHSRQDRPRYPAKLGLIRRLTVFLLLLALSPFLQAQQAAGSLIRPPAGGNWDRVKALPANTNLHISTDRGGKTCRIFAVTDDTLTCARNGKAGAVLQLAEIKRIKLTHYGRSTLVGAGIGGAIGATAGAIGGRTKPCPAGQSFCLNGVIIGPGGLAAIFGVGGGILGGVFGGVTDMTRGSSIYVRT
jgi:hypothetical protein